MKDRIIEIVEFGQPQSLIQRENAPITELIKTNVLIEELNQQLLLYDVIKSVCKHKYITDANWKSLTCRLCNDRIKPTQTVL
jgi:hypothetical protein